MVDMSRTHHPTLIKSIVLIVVVLVLALGTALSLYAVRIEPPRHASVTPPPVVEEMALRPGAVTERFVGYGTVRPDRVASITAEVTARIVARAAGVRAGASVRTGQLLFRLDDRDYRHALEQAQGALAADRAALEELEIDQGELERLIQTTETELSLSREEKDRVTRLFESDLAAKKEFDFANLAYQQARRTLQGYQREVARIAPRRAQVEAAMRQHEAAAAQAALNVERCRVVAPFDGTIESIGNEVGEQAGPVFEMLGPAGQMATIVDSRRVEIEIQLPASAYDRVRVGATARLTSEGAPATPWTGAVERLSPSVNPQTRTFIAYVAVDNTRQDHPLVPGVFVEARIEGPTYADRLVVPRGAITDGRVMVIADGAVHARRVEIERIIGDHAVVTGDVRPGDRIAVTRLTRLEDGDTVRTLGPETAKREDQ